MKKKFIENKKFRMAAVVLITVLIVAGFSYAWFIMRTTDLEQSLSVSNFDAEPYCYFEGSDTAATKDSEGLISLSTNPNAANYIGNFRVDVKYKGEGSAYLRVKMVHEFSTGGMATQSSAYVPYTTVGDWYDNRGNDYCFYYEKEIDDGNNETYTELEFINGVDAEGLEEIAEGVEIKVAVETDMVQINRYPQLWGISKLPWK